MAAKDTVNLEVSLSKKDYLHFNLMNSMKMVNAFVVYAVVFLFALTKMGYYGESSSFNSLASYLVKPVSMFVFFLVAYLLFVVYKSQTSYEKYPAIQKLHNYQLNTKQMYVKTENGEAKVLWDNIYLVKETKQMIIIYSSRAHAHVLTKSSFKCEDDISRLKEILKESIIKKKLKLKK